MRTNSEYLLFLITFIKTAARWAPPEEIDGRL